VRPPQELLAALRAWDAGGLSSWVQARELMGRLPLLPEEAQALAADLSPLELSSAEFERLIALLGVQLGLDYRRKLTVGKTIYGKDREVDLLFRHGGTGLRLAVEAKYQHGRGTADEKLPYAAKNLETLPLPGVIVYGGGGFSPGALHWLCANTRATDVARLAEWLTVFFAL
jgi:hypothetical protein